MKYPVVSLHCFHVVGLSITAAFEPVINMEHEAVIGVRPQNNMLHRRWDALPTYHQAPASFLGETMNLFFSVSTMTLPFLF